MLFLEMGWDEWVGGGRGWHCFRMASHDPQVVKFHSANLRQANDLDWMFSCFDLELFFSGDLSKCLGSLKKGNIFDYLIEGGELVETFPPAFQCLSLVGGVVATWPAQTF